MLQVIFGAGKGRRHVIIAVERQYLEMAVGAHRAGQVQRGVRRRHRPAAAARCAVALVPGRADLLVEIRAVAERRLVAERAEQIGIERRDIGAADRGVGRVKFGIGGAVVDIDADEAGIQPADGAAAVAHQLLAEPAEVDAQLVLQDEPLGQTGIGGELGGDRIALTIGQVVALGQCGQIGPQGKGAHFAQERLQRRRPVGQAVMIPGGGGIAGQIGDVDLVIARIADAIVQDRRQQHHAVHLHAAFLQRVDQARRAQRAIAFAEQEFGRIPAIVDRQIALDGAGKGINVRIDTPEILALCLAERARQASADRVDEDQVAAVDQAVGIGADGEGRGAGGIGRRRIHPDGAKGADVQPHGRRTRTAVEQEGDGAFLRALGPIGDIGGVEHARDRLAGIVADRQRAGRGRIVDQLAGDRHRPAAGHRLFLDRGDGAIVLLGLFLLRRGRLVGGDRRRSQCRQQQGKGGICDVFRDHDSACCLNSRRTVHRIPNLSNAHMRHLCKVPREDHIYENPLAPARRRCRIAARRAGIGAGLRCRAGQAGRPCHPRFRLSLR